MIIIALIWHSMFGHCDDIKMSITISNQTEIASKRRKNVYTQAPRTRFNKINKFEFSAKTTLSFTSALAHYHRSANDEPYILWNGNEQSIVSDGLLKGIFWIPKQKIDHYPKNQNLICLWLISEWKFSISESIIYDTLRFKLTPIHL